MSAQKSQANTFTHGHALIIGTGSDAYGVTDAQFNSTINDAEWLHQILTDKSRCAYPVDQVTLLTSTNASRRGILRKLENLATKTRGDPESTVIIFFSGHGIRKLRDVGDLNDDGEKYDSFIVPNGMRPDADLTDNAISGQELYEKILALRSKKCLLLLNSCFAGGIIPSLSTGDNSSEQSLGLSNVPLTKSQIDELKEGKGLAVLSSCRYGESSITGKPGGKFGTSNLKKYSWFTLGIGSALSGAGQSSKEGEVRISELALSCHQFVSDMTQKRQNPYFDFKKLENFVVAYYHAGLAPKIRWSLGGDDDEVDRSVVDDEALNARPGIITENYSIFANEGAVASKTMNFNGSGTYTIGGSKR